jgi:hypothetical protein
VRRTPDSRNVLPADLLLRDSRAHQGEPAAAVPGTIASFRKLGLRGGDHPRLSVLPPPEAKLICRETSCRGILVAGRTRG